MLALKSTTSTLTTFYGSEIPPQRFVNNEYIEEGNPQTDPTAMKSLADVTIASYMLLTNVKFPKQANWNGL